MKSDLLRPVMPMASWWNDLWQQIKEWLLPPEPVPVPVPVRPRRR